MKAERITAAALSAVMAFSMISIDTAAAANTDYYIGTANVFSAVDLSQLSVPENVSSTNGAVAYVREQMRQRVHDFSVTFPCSGSIDGKATVLDVLAKAMWVTGNGDEGDYLRFSLKSYHTDYKLNWGSITLYYELDYYSTAEQEKDVSITLNDIEAGLLAEYDSRSDYEKISAVYDFVAHNAVYASDFLDDRVYTAYGALINGECVCQGYSLLLYRMLNDMGLNCRIISGTSDGQRHSWNIVHLGDKYFYLDPTWDSLLGGSDGAYFLRGYADFDEFNPTGAHIPVYEYKEIFPDYESAEFKAEYPQAEKQFILGDANEDGVIDGKDASYVLTCYAMMSVDSDFSMPPVAAEAADITGDRIIDGNDASKLLSYYAAVSAGKKLSLKQYINQR